MKKSNMTGWKDVYKFTFIQTLKSKAFIISFIIFITLASISMPLINTIFSDNTDDINAPNPIQKVYVLNETTLPDMNFSVGLTTDTMKHITFEPMQEAYDDVTDRIENKERNSIILSITENNNVYSLNFTKASEGPVKSSHLHLFANTISEQFYEYRIKTLGIREDQLDLLNATVDTKVTLTDSFGEEIVKENTKISHSEYWFVYGLLFIVLMVNVMASSQIATSIVTEKSTRVIEYLLTSVKPLALMVGKILAMLSVVLLQMSAMVAILFVSNRLSATLTSGNKQSAMDQFLPSNVFENINLFNIVICFILVLLGMLFYSTLAGLAGATVSKLEEVGEGLTLFTFSNMIGAYVGIGAANVLMAAGMNSFVTFAFLFPLSAPFILPGAIILGKASLPLVLGAILLQILFILLLFRFVAKVYETLILHNGNKIKVSELLKISKTV